MKFLLNEYTAQHISAIFVTKKISTVRERGSYKIGSTITIRIRDEKTNQDIAEGSGRIVRIIDPMQIARDAPDMDLMTRFRSILVNRIGSYTLYKRVDEWITMLEKMYNRPIEEIARISIVIDIEVEDIKFVRGFTEDDILAYPSVFQESKN